MKRVLISWIGRADLKAAEKGAPHEAPGPVLRLLQVESFDEIHLLNDIGPEAKVQGESTPEQFRQWLVTQPKIAEAMIQLHNAPENLRNDYGKAFEFTRKMVREIIKKHDTDPARFAIALSSGYPAAQAAFIIVHQTLLGTDTEMFLTSRERGVERVELPFLLSVDVIPVIQQRLMESCDVKVSEGFSRIVGESYAIKRAKQIAQQVAPFDQTSVIVRGETGTGKELFAEAIHKASGRRGPFIAVNCAAIPDALLESELFGHVKGAFTDAKRDRDGKLAAADRGTLFLDEIGDMQPKLQAKLLRFLQEKTYCPVGADAEKRADVRIVAATHQDLERAIEQGQFRADLYYRLNAVSIELPPLRERGSDVKLLAEKFLEEFNERQKTHKSWSDEALAALLRYPWRGNVRELQNAVGRLAIFSRADRITLQDVDLWLGPPDARTDIPLDRQSASSLISHLAAVLDVLLGKLDRSGELPFLPDEKKNLIEGLLYPLLVGRGLCHTKGNASRAGELIRGNKLDLTESKPDARRNRHYKEKLQPLIDEELIRRLRLHAE